MSDHADPRSLEERRVADFLAPLSELDSVVRPRPRRTTASRRSLVLAIAVLALAASGGAFAATQLFGPLHGGEYRPSGGPVICQIFGLPGPAAAPLLDQQGYSVVYDVIEGRGRSRCKSERAGDPAENATHVCSRPERYGLSIESGESIPDERLEALPAAERTVEELGEH